MTKTLVTGATGTIGNAVAHQLIAKGRAVRCLVRSPEAARTVVPKGVELVRGDVTDPASIEAAMQGIEAVFHAAGMPEQWARDTRIFDRINAGGTGNMVEVALKAGVSSFVYTSTQDMFDQTRDPFDETMLSLKPLKSHYERSKQKAERLVEAGLDKGLPVKFIHPVATYGPVPGAVTGLNTLLKDLAAGDVPILLPGGFPVVLNEDVASLQLLAEESAEAGARFIASESYQSLKDIAEAVAALVPDAKVPGMMPGWTASLIATTGEMISGLTRKAPLITRGELGVLQRTGRPSAEKAKRELGWSPTAFSEGLKCTLLDIQDK
ncbi:MAG: SDR family NAD(P)-dependent oxidoreductase [Hyphomonadaceae bacterium]